MFLTLKAMPGHFWERCQVGVSHKSGECVREKWMWILYCKKDHRVHETALPHFTATAYSSVPSNGGKQVMLTKQTLLLVLKWDSALFPTCVWALFHMIFLTWFHLPPGAKISELSAFFSLKWRALQTNKSNLILQNTPRSKQWRSQVKYQGCQINPEAAQEIKKPKLFANWNQQQILLPLWGLEASFLIIQKQSELGLHFLAYVH